MAIDSRTLVEPAGAIAGIDADDDAVPGADGEKVGDVVVERRVAAVVAAEITAVNEDHRVAESAVELDGDASAGIARRNVELAPIPSDAGLRILAAEGLKAVRRQGIVPDEGQFDRPVVGQVERAPFGVVEADLGEVEAAGLGKALLIFAEAQVASGIVGVAELELPAKVEEQLLARRDG